MKLKEIQLGHLHLPNNVFMAPLAGYTCYPFRMLCNELGAAMTYTEMISSNCLRHKDRITSELLYTTDDEKIKAVQLIGSDPRIMEEMALSYMFEQFDIIDINMGCPVPNVVRNGEGSALLDDFPTAASIIKSCKKSGKIVTVKFRVGLKEDKLITSEFAKLCEDSGADLITIHGRSRNMMYSGKPYYDEIAKAKSVVSIPVIANGDIFSSGDATKMMNLTGADGIMIARYGLENPLIFSQLTGTPITKTKHTILLEQIELTSKHYDKEFTLIYIKKIASYFMKKLKGTKQYKMQLHNCGNLTELRNIINKIFYEEGEKNG